MLPCHDLTPLPPPPRARLSAPCAAISEPRTARLAIVVRDHRPSNGLIVRLLLGLLFALAVAALIGLGTTWLTLTRGTAFGAVAVGAWTAFPKTGTRDIDPYARASIARSGELPIGSGDGVSFYARTEIGRASCREGVGFGGVRVSL